MSECKEVGFSFDLSLMPPSNTYTIEERLRAVQVYMIYGNMKKVERDLGIPYDTLKDWKYKSQWWEPAMKECKKAKNEELDGTLTQVVHEAGDAILDRIRYGDTKVDKDGELVRVPMSGRDLAGVLHLMHDKRALLRGDPTQKIQTTTASENLSALEKKFESIAKMLHEKTIEGEVVRGED